MEGEIRTRESFWDNRLAVYRLTRLGHLHLLSVYVLAVLNFWMCRNDRCIFCWTRKQSRLSNKYKRKQRIQVIVNSAVFYKNSLLYDSL